MAAADDITIILTKDQALVFYEWVKREDSDKGNLPTESEAERKALAAIWVQIE